MVQPVTGSVNEVTFICGGDGYSSEIYGGDFIGLDVTGLDFMTTRLTTAGFHSV